MLAPLALRGLMLAFGASSLVTGLRMIGSPKRAWAAFGVHSVPDHATVPSICYGASIVGEGCLQLLAHWSPRQFMLPALAFMVPYKVHSALGLALAAWRGHVSVREARLVAAQWLAPVALSAVAILLDGGASSKGLRAVEA